MKSENRSYFIGYLLLFVGALLLMRRILIWGGIGEYIVMAGLVAASLALGRTYLQDDRKWWSIIPAGAALTIAVVMLLRTLGVLPYGSKNVILYLGFALPFWILWVERRRQAAYQWTVYPAILLTIGSSLSYGNFKGWISGDYFIAILILSTGVLLLIRSWTRNR
jgi:hypothetical protein